jgi:hypothetical protein
MDQRLIVPCFSRAEFSAMEIHSDFVAILGQEAASYSSMTRHLPEAIFDSSNHPAKVPEAKPQFDGCDEAILLALARQQFASIRELARQTHLPQTTVHRRLTQSLRLRVRHLRWVPRLLSHCQKLDQVTLSQLFSSVLEQQERRPWHHMVTLDESWFYLNMDHELIWLQPLFR